jgi:hypothetical protein
VTSVPAEKTATSSPLASTSQAVVAAAPAASVLQKSFDPHVPMAVAVPEPPAVTPSMSQ